MKSALEESLAVQIRAVGLPVPEREHRFCQRRWRLDFAWPSKMVAVEIEGGIFRNGRHNRGPGFAADCEKYAKALILGWRVLRVTGQMVKSGEALTYLETLLK